MDILDVALKILREAGLPAVAMIFALYFIWRIGVNFREAIMWSGPKFMLPIRDGIIENIGFLTRFVTRADELLPKIHGEQLRVTEKIEDTTETQVKIAADVYRIKIMQKAMSTVISHQCEAADCWFKKNKRTFDSDTFCDENKPDQQKQ